MISTAINNTATVRNVFIIDDKGIVRTVLVYPMQIGRCIPEILRIVEALQLSDKESVLTPANWVNGCPVIVPPPQTFGELKERINEIEKNKNGMNWYLSFKMPEQLNEKNDEKIL